MKIIVIIILVACVTTSPILASLVDHIPHDDQDGILKCIFDRDNPVKTINKVKSFCGNETQDNFKCYSSYASFKLCLISNECQYKLDDPEVRIQWYRSVWIAGIVGSTWSQMQQKCKSSKRKFNHVQPMKDIWGFTWLFWSFCWLCWLCDSGRL